MRGRVNYDTEVWCKHCGEKRSKTECKLIPNWGCKCPECKRKCRVKAYYKINRELHPYIPRRTYRYMHKEIKELVKEKAWLV